MKTVIIPNDYHPFVIEVNGVKYTYPEGTEQSVPDEVASAIEHYYKLQPKEKPADGGVLPWVSKENDGDVLKVEDGVWKPGEGSGGGLKKTDLYFRSTGQLDGVIADDEVEYLPVIATMSVEVSSISNETAFSANVPHIFGRSSTASAGAVEVSYAIAPLIYKLTAESVMSLLSTGEASETVAIRVGTPSKLWDSIIVSMWPNELLCRRITASNSDHGTYQGFLNVVGGSTMQAGLYAAVVNITRTNNNYAFDFSLFPVSSGGGDSDIFTMHVEYNDDDSSNPFTITESAVDISNAIDAKKIIKMIFEGSGAEYDFNGVAIPFSYTCEGVYEGEVGDIWIHMNDPYNNTVKILHYSHTTQKWSW